MDQPNQITLDPDAKRITGTHQGQPVHRNLSDDELSLILLALLTGSPSGEFSDMVTAKHPPVRDLADNRPDSFYALADKIGVGA